MKASLFLGSIACFIFSIICSNKEIAFCTYILLTAILACTTIILDKIDKTNKNES